MEILKSTDYNRFKNITGNRNLNQKKIEKIVNDIKNGLNLLQYCPILVYSSENKFKIVDGQHRFEASKITNNPIHYVVSEELTLQQIAAINSNQDKWTQNDFLNCYINIGIEDYIKLKKILQRFKIGISFASELLMEGKIGSRTLVVEKFRSGNFKVNFYKETEELLELSHSLFDRYNFYTDRHLISAVQELKTKGLCDFNLLKEKISMAPMMMDRQGTIKDYIFNIERIYNYKNQKRQIIF